VCWPSSSKFWYASASPARFDQSVRISTHEPAAMRPCADSKRSMSSTVIR
jgi:hypothetical protein